MAFDVQMLRQLADLPLPSDPVELARVWRHVGLDLCAAADHIDGLEKTLAVLYEVLPKVIVEAANDIHKAYLDGREPDFSEETIANRMHRIIAEKFSA